MPNRRLLEQFRHFSQSNKIDEMERLIEYFAVFGGLDIKLECDLDIKELLQIHIIANLKELEHKILRLTYGSSEYTRLLRALAVGDRRIFSAFNKAGLNNANGGSALNFLQKHNLIEIEYSREEPAKSLHPNTKLKRELARHRISHKALFIHPFLRFWFYFIAPNMRLLKEGRSDLFLKDFTAKFSSYTSLVFEELSEILLDYHLRDSQIISSGSYWDANVEIDILTVTEDEKIFVAECKWTNGTINKGEWHKLLEKCSKLGISPSQCIFFAKRGFSKELLLHKGRDLALYTANDFTLLIKQNPQPNRAYFCF